MKKIKKCLNEFNARGAFAVLRASRELWPEDEVFVSPEVRPEEEHLILREIFLADQRSEFASFRKSFIDFHLISLDVPANQVDDDVDFGGPDEDGDAEEGEGENLKARKSENHFHSCCLCLLIN
jgi:hypothetical protein